MYNKLGWVERSGGFDGAWVLASCHAWCVLCIAAPGLVARRCWARGDVSTADEMVVDGEVDGVGGAEEVGLLEHSGHPAFPAVRYASAGEKAFASKISAAWVGFGANL